MRRKGWWRNEIGGGRYLWGGEMKWTTLVHFVRTFCNGGVEGRWQVSSGAFMSKRFRHVVSLVVAVGFALSVAGYLTYEHQRAIDQRKEIAAFSAGIAVGMPKGAAMRACESAADEHREWAFKYWETCEIAGGLSAARVDSPLTVGAGNWVVWIVFDGDAVAAVLIRTLDSSRLRPDDAPEDRVDDPSRPQLAEFAPHN